jgi:iron complex transport system permease protein
MSPPKKKSGAGTRPTTTKSGARAGTARPGVPRSLPKAAASAARTAPPKKPGGSKAAPLPALVVGTISPLTRVAGALGVVAAVLLLVRPALPLVRDGGRAVGAAHNLWDFVVPLPAVLAVAVAGALCVLGRVPRFGLAVLIATGGYGLGELLRTLSLLDTTGHTSIDLPLPEGLVRSFRYTAGSGLVLQVVALATLAAVLVVALLAWRRTEMDDDGSFDGLRPTFGGLGFAGALIGFAALAFPAVSVVPGGLTFAVPSLFERSGLDLFGGWVLIAAVTAAAVGAATVRPRLAVVGMFAGLAAMFGTAALGSLLLAVRSTALNADTGTAFQVAAAVVFAGLAVAAWRITWRPARERV